MEKQSSCYRLKPVALVIIAAYLPVSYAGSVSQSPDGGAKPSEQVSFDSIFLSPGMVRRVDLSRFEQGSTVVPGTYQADIYVDDLSIVKSNILFKEMPDKSIQLCLLPSVIKSLGLNYDEMTAGARELIKNDDNGCVLAKKIIPGLGISFDSGSQRLDLTVPQASLVHSGRGYVSPELWDGGVPALLLGYNSNFYSTRSSGETSNSGYVGLNAGLNLGDWYFRHNGNYNWQEKGAKGYQRINSYVQRDIPGISGRLIVGENSTNGRVFDTLPYRGVSLMDDERMLPQSERGYAPTVRGIARTNAKVTVRQNGQIIYETTVSPGAFNIPDLYPTGYGGDLNVTITEADGSLQQFNVPYASTAQLLRPGAHHYTVVAGELNDTTLSGHPRLYQLAYERGLTNTFTGYGGLQGNEDYQAAQLGTAVNTPLGAVAFDVTQARSQLGDVGADAEDGINNTMQGQSYRVSYSKFITDTDSNLSIAAYRFSTSGYMDFHTAMQARDAVSHGYNASLLYRPKNKLTITANQGLPESWGQLYVSGYVQNYWNNATTSDLQYQAGYNNNIGSLSFSLNAGRARNGQGEMETTFLFNLSMPLGRADRMNVPQFNASFNRSGNGTVGETAGISGTGGEDHQFSYGLTGSHYNQGTGSSGTVNGQYRSPYTDLSASYGSGKGYQSTSAGMSGTLIAYQDGLVMTPYTGDTFAIVEAKGAAGAKVSSYSGLRIDPWGHAAVPYLNPYEMNDVDIDPKGLPYNTELETTSQKVVPNAGAVVRLKYTTQQGYPLLINTHMNDQSVTPFGADVVDEKGNTVGAIGQGGIAYVRVGATKGRLTVKWGSESAQRCTMSYQMISEADGEKSPSVNRLDLICQRTN